jgi:probable rRNA maturation factor
MGGIHFFEEKRTPWFVERRKMKALLLELFAKEKRGLDRIQVILMSDPQLLELNRTFLQHDYFTDIITFDNTPQGAAISGEIYISVDRVEENAITWKTTKINELRRVIIHGCLHLCGYKDKLKTDQVQMRQREDYYLSRYSKRST